MNASKYNYFITNSTVNRELTPQSPLGIKCIHPLEKGILLRHGNQAFHLKVGCFYQSELLFKIRMFRCSLFTLIVPCKDIFLCVCVC